MLRDTGGVKGADSLLLGKRSEGPSLRERLMAAGEVPGGAGPWEKEQCRLASTALCSHLPGDTDLSGPSSGVGGH